MLGGILDGGITADVKLFNEEEWDSCAQRTQVNF